MMEVVEFNQDCISIESFLSEGETKILTLICSNYEDPLAICLASLKCILVFDAKSPSAVSYLRDLLDNSDIQIATSFGIVDADILKTKFSIFLDEAYDLQAFDVSYKIRRHILGSGKTAKMTVEQAYKLDIRRLSYQELVNEYCDKDIIVSVHDSEYDNFQISPLNETAIEIIRKKCAHGPAIYRSIFQKYCGFLEKFNKNIYGLLAKSTDSAAEIFKRRNDNRYQTLKLLNEVETESSVDINTDEDASSNVNCNDNLSE